MVYPQFYLVYPYGVLSDVSPDYLSLCNIFHTGGIDKVYPQCVLSGVP